MMKMLSQPYTKLELNHTPTEQDDFNKATRLSDIRKGADFTKMVNDLADQQWRGNSVMPRIVEMEERDTPKKYGTSFQFDEPQLLQTSTAIKPVPPPRATPLKPVSRHSRPNSGRSSTGTTSRELQDIPPSRSSVMSAILNSYTNNNTDNLTNSRRHNVYTNYNRKISNGDLIIHRNHPVALPEITRDPKSSIDLEEVYFNTWGSRDLGMDSKLIPEKVPRVIAPKQYLPSSRLGSQNYERHLRTETDFRSRNGVITIVAPLKPLPQIAHFQYPQTDVAVDSENIAREKTYVTLKRIDQILNPQQTYITGELNSSELEILGSGSSTPVYAKKKNEETRRGNSNHERRQRSYVNHSGRITTNHAYPIGRGQIPKTSPSVHKRPESKSLSPILKSLECEKITSYEKCLKWVDKCDKWH